MGDPKSGRGGRYPSFQFYPGDWLASEKVAAMSMAQRGIYIHLLSHAWIAGGTIPADIPTLARVCGMNIGTFRQLWPRVAVCWVEVKMALAGSKSGVNPHGGVRLENPRMRIELAQLERRVQKMALAGITGANARWQPHSDRIQTAMPRDSSSSSSSEYLSTDTPPTPRKRGASRRTPETWQQVLARPEYDHLRGDPEFVPAWERWIAHCSETGSKASVPHGARAAEILNDASRWGAPKFAQAVHEAIAHNWQGMFEPKANGNNETGLAPNPFLRQLSERQP